MNIYKLYMCTTFINSVVLNFLDCGLPLVNIFVYISPSCVCIIYLKSYTYVRLSLVTILEQEIYLERDPLLIMHLYLFK